MTSRLVLILLTIFILLCSSYGEQNIVCRDENGQPIDWFYLYKLPKQKLEKSNLLIKEGLAYMFITPDTIKKGWTLSKKSINDTKSMPGLTLSPLYEENDVVKIIYNDEVPDDKLKKHVSHKRIKHVHVANDGHTKGVILGDNKNGIWLIHSVPKYPPAPAPENTVNDISYSYPKTGKTYGQSFLCLSLQSEEMENIGKQLKFNEPKLIYSHFPKEVIAHYSNLIDVVNNNTVKNSPWFNVLELVSKDGTQFVSFAKSGRFHDDIYESLVAPELERNLLVESWINGPGVLSSNCSEKYNVNNVIKVAFHDLNLAFTSHLDHSKWAISNGPTDKENDWVCVGDINRAEHQEMRGGGTVCHKNNLLWKHYSSLVNDIMPCPKLKKPKTTSLSSKWTWYLVR